jgi:hypothetical protein
MARSKWFVAGAVVLIVAAALSAAETEKKDEPIIAAGDVTSVISYDMASPRAFLMGVPIEGSDDMGMIGAAENFARADGTLEIPVGTRVIFSLSQGTEGVWQQGAYGTIETTLTVEWFPTSSTGTCDACASADASTSCPWTTVGMEGARDTRTGPSLGYTKVGVPVEFTEAGTYCVRGIVSTSVMSSYLRSDTQSDALLAADTDIVLVKVRVLSSGKPQGALTSEPEAVYMVPMPNTSDTRDDAGTGTEKDTKGDSGAIKASSPGLFLGTQELKYAMAL